jgi:hypothetical protein
MANINKEIERIEKGDAWNETDEVVQVEVKKPLNMVIPIRLATDKWEELRHEASELGIGPTTLARMWILERLRQKDLNIIAAERGQKYAPNSRDVAKNKREANSKAVRKS